MKLRRLPPLVLALALALLASTATAPAADAAKKPKDRTPPRSVIHTEDGAVKVGMDADRDAPAQPPEPLYEHTIVEGMSADRKGGRIDYVVIRFTREDPVAGTLGEIETATCEPPRRTCHWTARVPWLDDDLIDADPVLGVTHGIPAIWEVQVKAYDEAGNVERGGPTITIVVI